MLQCQMYSPASVKHWRPVALILLATIMLSAHGYGADQPASGQRPAFGPYCGLRALYAAAKYEGRSVAFTSFLQPKYLGSAQGSSLGELQQCAQDMGLYSLPLQNISESVLHDLKHPLILHVRKDYDSKSYNHYIVCLRTVSDGVRVLDPPDSIDTVSIHKLLAQTDGIGLVVSASPGLDAEILGPSRGKAAAFGIAAFVLCFGIRWLRPVQTAPTASEARKALPISIRRLFAHAASLAFLGMGLGLAYNTIADDGILATPLRGDVVAPDVDAQILPRQEVQYLIEKGLAVIVDARLKSDFDAGHIPGAINIPVDSSDNERHDAMQGVAHDSEVVVYCQSKGCPYSGRVTAGLRADGFTHLSIYKDGWIDWARGVKTTSTN